MLAEHVRGCLMERIIEPNKLSTYLDKVINTNTINVYSALLNLEERDIFEEVIFLLYNNRINLRTIVSLPMIDDDNVKELLDNRRLNIYPTFDFATSSDEFSPYDHILGTDETPTKLGVLFKEYNSYMTDSVRDAIRTEGDPYSPLYTEFGGEKGSIYSGYIDYLNSFESRILTPLLEKYSVLEINDIFPKLEITEDLTDFELTFINSLYHTILGKLGSYFTNTELHKMFVWTEEEPSIFTEEVTLFNELLNITRYSTVIEDNLIDAIYTLQDMGYPNPNAAMLTNMKRGILMADMKNSTVSDTLSHFVFFLTFINTLEQESNIPVNDSLLIEVNKLYSLVEEFKRLYVEVTSLITSELYIKVD